MNDVFWIVTSYNLRDRDLEDVDDMFNIYINII